MLFALVMHPLTITFASLSQVLIVRAAAFTEARQFLHAHFWQASVIKYVAGTLISIRLRKVALTARVMPVDSMATLVAGSIAARGVGLDCGSGKGEGEGNCMDVR
ncbi:uncharacterized protein V1518DRAFT_423457 [Limtongia smithiae]|uniref:uncharacterized protein n=1 Tax=Limtongia smithiae TaxID=1125753 RepID=UPI0034CD8A8D